MTEYGHLQTYTMTLKTQSPLFIGSGEELAKTDYLFNPGSGVLSALDIHKLLPWLAEHKLGDRYESFILSGQTNMFSFLKHECSISDQELRKMYLYSVDATDALDENHALKHIQTFVRNGNNQVCIPGSSLKGALHTVILFSLIEKEETSHTPVQLEQRRKTFDYIGESKYLSTLNFNGKTNPIVSSIMRGISVSDSLPVPDKSMIITSKWDSSVYGNVKRLPVCRECIRPGTEIVFEVTLDQSVLHETITVDSINAAIRSFMTYYRKEYLSKFDAPKESVILRGDNMLVLGGGAGFFSKTLTYPYFGSNALSMVSEFFQNGPQSRNHHHEEDVNLGISPHMLKYTKFDDRYYPYGFCEVQIQ